MPLGSLPHHAWWSSMQRTARTAKTSNQCGRTPSSSGSRRMEAKTAVSHGRRRSVSGKAGRRARTSRSARKPAWRAFPPSSSTTERLKTSSWMTALLPSLWISWTPTSIRRPTTGRRRRCARSRRPLPVAAPLRLRRPRPPWRWQHSRLRRAWWRGAAPRAPPVDPAARRHARATAPRAPWRASCEPQSLGLPRARATRRAV
mmetsp:Transcript_79443/g.207182  ORF Transcript_79443/g.207182 Transcript_79443/m.207182 type:complete len:202 (-) Transcript_79443:46-651(-)